MSTKTLRTIQPVHKSDQVTVAQAGSITTEHWIGQPCLGVFPRLALFYCAL